jgi:hypothetical protein
LVRRVWAPQRRHQPRSAVPGRLVRMCSHGDLNLSISEYLQMASENGGTHDVLLYKSSIFLKRLSIINHPATFHYNHPAKPPFMESPKYLQIGWIKIWLPAAPAAAPAIRRLDDRWVIFLSGKLQNWESQISLSDTIGIWCRKHGKTTISTMQLSWHNSFLAGIDFLSSKMID